MYLDSHSTLMQRYLESVSDELLVKGITMFHAHARPLMIGDARSNYVLTSVAS